MKNSLNIKCLIYVNILLLLFLTGCLRQNYQKNNKNQELSTANSGNRTLLTQKISEHLSYLGYKIEKNKIKNKDIFIARHDNFFNFFFLENKPIVFFTMSFGLSEYGKKNINNLLRELNKLNRNTFITTFFFDKRNDRVVIKTRYVGKYEKMLFSKFIDLYTVESKRIASLKKYFT